jgi:hypothetical protein
MPVHEDHPLSDQAICGVHRLFGIAPVVTQHQPQWLPEHSALGVDRIDRSRSAATKLFAEHREVAAHRPGGADRNLVAARFARRLLRGAGRQEDGGEARKGNRSDCADHARHFSKGLARS